MEVIGLSRAVKLIRPLEFGAACVGTDDAATPEQCNTAFCVGFFVAAAARGVRQTIKTILEYWMRRRQPSQFGRPHGRLGVLQQSEVGSPGLAGRLRRSPISLTVRGLTSRSLANSDCFSPDDLRHALDLS